MGHLEENNNGNNKGTSFRNFGQWERNCNEKCQEQISTTTDIGTTGPIKKVFPRLRFNPPGPVRNHAT